MRAELIAFLLLMALALALAAASVLRADELPLPPTPDTDGDTFSDALEQHIGTEHEWACTDDTAIDVFPPDLNHDTYSDINDIVAVAGAFGQPVGTAPVRYDLAPEPAGDGLIDIGDIVRLAGLFGQTCANFTVVEAGEAVTFTVSSSDEAPAGQIGTASAGAWHTCYNRVSGFSGALIVTQRVTFESSGSSILQWDTAGWSEVTGGWYKSEPIIHYSAFGFPSPPYWPHHGWTLTQQRFSRADLGGREWVGTVWSDWYENRTCRHGFQRFWTVP